MSIAVHSEVGALERVVVHRPGAEVLRMDQSELEDLLFDDILAADLAGREHDLMRAILEGEGAEVLEVVELLAEGVRTGPAEALQALVRQVADLAAQPELGTLLLDLEPDVLAQGLVEGIEFRTLNAAPPTLHRLGSRLAGERMALAPVPNLMFTRDPCIPIFDAVAVGRMATDARARESLLVRFALQHGLDEPPPFVFDAADWHRHPDLRALEGGDVLVVDPRFLLIGCSERTTAQTIERLAREALFPRFEGLERIYAVMMPKRRSVMHLDTVLTQIDRSLFLGHVPMIANGVDTTVAVLDRDGARLLEGATVLDVLRAELDDVQLVPCGGDDPLFQRREQWTDGANAVCLRPGHLVLYNRNVRTIAALREDFGFHEVRLSLEIDERTRKALLTLARSHDRVVYTFAGSELSRARGGARCMTMPLQRAALS